MKVTLKPIAIATALVAILATSAMPVAAAQPDGAYAVLTAGTYGRGLVTMRYTGTTTVNGGVLGLLASRQYVLIGRSIGCGGQPSSANRMFGLTAMTNASGVLNFSRSVSIAGRVRSIWLAPTDGSRPTVCSLTVNFATINVAAGDFNGDGALGLSKTGPGTLAAIALVEKRSMGQARVSVVLHGLAGGDSYMVLGVGAACGNSFNSSQQYVSLTLTNVQVTSFKSTTVQLSQDGLDALRSMRIKNATRGTGWACVPLRITVPAIDLNDAPG